MGFAFTLFYKMDVTATEKMQRGFFRPVIQVEKEKREEESRVTERVKMKASREDRVEIYL